MALAITGRRWPAAIKTSLRGTSKCAGHRVGAKNGLRDYGALFLVRDLANGGETTAAGCGPHAHAGGGEERSEAGRPYGPHL